MLNPLINLGGGGGGRRGGGKGKRERKQKWPLILFPSNQQDLRLHSYYLVSCRLILLEGLLYVEMEAFGHFFNV